MRCVYLLDSFFSTLAWTRRCAVRIMSAHSLSSTGRAFQSPFNHVDMYGSQHPTCAMLSGVASQSLSVCNTSSAGRHKSKAKKLGSADCRSATLSASAAKPRKKKKKKKKERSSNTVSAPSVYRSCSSRSEPSGSGVCSMAQVDGDTLSQPLQVKQPRVNQPRVSASSCKLIKTQMTENQKTKTRFSQPPTSSASSNTSKIAASSGPLPGKLFGDSVSSPLQGGGTKEVVAREVVARKMVAAHGERSERGIPAHVERDVVSAHEETWKSDMFGERGVIPAHLAHSKMSTSAFMLSLSSSHNQSSSHSPSSYHSPTSSSHHPHASSSHYPPSSSYHHPPSSSSRHPPSSSSRHPPPSSSHHPLSSSSRHPSHHRPSNLSSTSSSSTTSSAANVCLHPKPLQLHAQPPHLQSSQRLYRTHPQSAVAVGSRAKGVGPLECIVRGLKCMQFQQIIVMSGAGISTPSGIPDFR